MELQGDEREERLDAQRAEAMDAASGEGFGLAGLRGLPLEAIRTMADHTIGALLVMQDAQLVGIVSERDVVRALAAHGAGALGRPVGSVMSTDVVTCVADDAVEGEGDVLGDVVVAEAR